MTSLKSARGRLAFTVIELVFVIAVVVFGVFFILTAIPRGPYKSIRINCASNLKQVALAFRIWEGDNGDKFPMSATNALGNLMFPAGTSNYLYFQAMSYELSNPKVLFCPAETKRTWATNFTTDFNPSHISYFIGLDADEAFPQRFLAGDSNITNGTKLINGILELATNRPAGWTKDRHHLAGNVALADGSVWQWSTSALQTALQKTGLATNRLLMP